MATAGVSPAEPRASVLPRNGFDPRRPSTVGLRTSDGRLRVEMVDTIKELVREESAAVPRGTRLAKGAA